MNLGQLIGRLRMEAENATPVVEDKKKRYGPTRKLSEGGVAGEIRKVLRIATTPLSTSEIAARTNGALTTTQVSTNINHMPDVVRSGERPGSGYKFALAVAE